MAESKQQPNRRLGRCPICDAPARRESRPFCSRRCADADLGRWLTGAYRMPTDERPAITPDGESPDDSDYPNGGG
ncbi:MAG: DNA gyrase inhibitor YacG [Alphaproteobacteria bacterium]